MRDVRVGRWFSRREFGTSRGSDIAPLRRLCSLYLDPLRDRFGPCTVVSGRRSRRHNEAVGGAPRSHHVYEFYRGQPAADVVFTEGSAAEWFDAAVELRATHGVGGIGEYEGHLHVDLGPRRTW